MERRKKGCWAGGQYTAPALLFVSLLVATASAQSGPAPRWPQEARGQIHFVADGALLLDGAGDAEVYFSLAVPQGEVSCVAREGEQGLWLDLGLAVATLGRGDRQLLRQGRHLVVPCETGAGGSAGEQEPIPQDPFARRLFYLQLRRQPGATHYEITVEDRNADRMGLLHQIRREKNSGTARGVLEQGDLRDGRGLSGLIFLWTLPPHPALRQEDAFWLAPADSLRPWLEPNPSRSYGLLNPTVRFYLEAYGLDEGEGELRLRLMGPHDDRPLLQRATSLRLPDRRSGILGVADISALPPGSYRLEIEYAPWGESIAPFRVQGRLHILWDPLSWSRSQAEILEELTSILPDENRRELAALDPGEREAYLESLWVALGDLPAEGSSRRQARFADRVRTADRRYGWGQTRGASTDRGRIHIRYGAPDEVHKELIPQWKDQLFFFMKDQVDDLEQIGIDQRGALEWPDETGAPRSERRPRVHWLDDAAYQIWTYVGAGDPLVPGWAPPSRGRALEFIFVDRLGTGDYRLVYTNILGGH